MKKVSIIIPLKEINDYVKESFSYIEKIDYDKSALEVIVLPDTAGEIPGNHRRPRLYRYRVDRLLRTWLKYSHDRLR